VRKGVPKESKVMCMLGLRDAHENPLLIYSV
jgi:hypothetical protein